MGHLGVESTLHFNSHFVTTHSRVIIHLYTDWNTLSLGALLTQLDDDRQEFMVAYVKRSNNKTKAKYNLYEGECFDVVWVVSSFIVTYMVVHSL
jgi:hypothetical protein